MPQHKLLFALYEGQYEPIKIRSRRPNTKRLYRATLKEFALFLTRPPTLADLNDATVSRFAAHRLNGGLAKRTINKDLFNLLALWRWLHTKGYVTNWPAVEMETPPVRVPIALLRDEIDRMMEAIDAERLPVGSISPPLFWRALMLVIWDTGERIGALMALTWDQVDLDGGWVRFVAETRKGAMEDNLLPIAADTRDALRKIRPRSAVGSDLVYRWPYSATYIYRRLGRIMRQAGLPDNRQYKFHVVRKSVASHYEAAGGNATDLLKHSSRKVTMSYLDPRIVKPVAPVDLLFRPGSAVPSQ
jgi:integrase